MKVKQIVFHHKTTLNIVVLFYLQCRCLFNKFIGSNLKKIEPSWKNTTFHHTLKEECVQICCDLLKCTVFWYKFHTAGKRIYLYIVCYYHMCQTEFSFATFQKIYRLIPGRQLSLYMYVCHIYFKALTITSIFPGRIEKKWLSFSLFNRENSWANW